MIKRNLTFRDQILPISENWPASYNFALFSKFPTNYTNISEKIKVLGKEGLGMFLVGAHSMHAGGYITEHEKLMSEKLAYVMCGGDLSEPTLVSEQYLLDLEREAFLSLCGERKTLERIEHMLKKGKPLRN